jgi:prepilin-type N-terminal cleavage/methylation domain-containing protein
MRITHSSQERPGRRSAFTLVEMLVVIVIIAILIGMVSSSLLQAKRHAMRTRAETQLRELLKAWTQYYQMYQGWPNEVTSAFTFSGALPDGSIPMTYDNLRPLIDTTTSPGALGANGYNTRGISFLSIKLNPGESFQDPWHNTYKVSFQHVTPTNEVALRVSIALPNRDRYRE